jgi:hypothetical protein
MKILSIQNTLFSFAEIFLSRTGGVSRMPSKIKQWRFIHPGL